MARPEASTADPASAAMSAVDDLRSAGRVATTVVVDADWVVVGGAGAWVVVGVVVAAGGGSDVGEVALVVGGGSGSGVGGVGTGVGSSAVAGTSSMSPTAPAGSASVQPGTMRSG
jgi:hypothetical protein